MSTRSHIIVICLCLTLLSVSVASAEENEALLMFHQEGYMPYTPGGGDDPGTPIRLVAGDQEALPQAVQDDIIALNDAIVLHTGGVFGRLISSTPNGRTLVVSKASEDDEAHGDVWIWPDWRDADNVIHFADSYSRAQPLSNYHVLLQHAPISHVGVYHVIDWREPETIYVFPTSFRRATIRAADNGRWACETRSRELFVGMFEGDNHDWLDDAVQIPFDGTLRQMTFLHGGDVLVMDYEPLDGGHELRTYIFPAPGEVQLVSTHDNSLVYHWDTRIQDSCFFGRKWEGEVNILEPNDDLIVFAVNQAGEVTAVIELDYDHDGRERPTGVSPSGKFTTTQRRNEIGGILYRMQQTPLADPTDPIPSDTHGNRSGTPVWVSWE